MATTLLVASGGGHLKQLHRLIPRLGVSEDRIWVTFDTALGRSLLKDENDVRFAPYANPHDLIGSTRDLVYAARLLHAQRSRNRPIEAVISTGANLAVAFLPLARLQGAQAHYIESATRSQGPSYTGRILQRIPGINLYTQHERLQGKKWKFSGSVFEGFVPDPLPSIPPVQKVVVTLGNNDTYPFQRLIRRLIEIIPTHVEVTWQLGTTISSIYVDGARSGIPVDELEASMREADVVIAHAGTGSALSALEAGKFPVLLPRLSSYGEHIDDHQLLTANELQNQGLAMSVDASEITWKDITVAASWRIIQNVSAEPFRLC